ncbi:MAG: hypothetical protein CFE21_06355 [Bacteroidetes bacterium B1(2017)]|nr:MAG: hypothetical protein CFE21_06355 [Bacteroidetes bacterium B1(2017)]
MLITDYQNRIFYIEYQTIKPKLDFLFQHGIELDFSNKTKIKHTMNKKFLFLLLASTLIMVSCKKNLQESATPSIAKASKVSELKASETFKWKTSKSLVLNVAGINTLTPINRTLIVSSLDGKSIYYSSLQLMSATTIINLVVPATNTEVLVTYGKIKKVIPISGNILQFDYNANN